MHNTLKKPQGESMKKQITIFLSLFFIFATSFASTNQLQYGFVGKEIEVENFNQKGKVICKNNLVISNASSKNLEVIVHAKKSADSEREYLGEVYLRPNETQEIKSKKALKNYKYILIASRYGDITVSQLICKNNDMYALINLVKEPPLNVSYDEKGTPISKDNLYIADIANIRSDNIFVENKTDSDVKIYYEKNGEWIYFDQAASSYSSLITRSSFKEWRFICLEYLGSNSTKYTIELKESFPFQLICIGYPTSKKEDSSTSISSKTPSLNVSYDETGTPISKDNLYIVNTTDFDGDIRIENTTDSDVKVYYEKNGDWITVREKVKPNDSFFLQKSTYKGSNFLCLEYLGLDSSSYIVQTEKSYSSYNICIGYPAPSWSGESFESIRQKTIEENLPDKDCKILVQSMTTSTPNYAGGVDVRIKFWNVSDKTIKYVYFTVEPYNRVDDVTASTIGGKSLVKLEAVNYIEQNQCYDATWENVWYNSTIAYAKIKNIKIIYKDNSVFEIGEDNITEICDINPFSCQLIKNDVFSLIPSYNNGRVYYNVISDSDFDDFNLLFETTPKTIYSKAKKNIEITFKDFEKQNSNSGRKIIRAVHPNYKTGLLYETLSITVTYKIKGSTEPLVIFIDDKETLEKIQNYAYLIEELGLM